MTVYVRPNSKKLERLGFRIQEKDLEVKKNNYWIMSFFEKEFGSQEKKFGSKLIKRRMRMDGSA